MIANNPQHNAAKKINVKTKSKRIFLLKSQIEHLQNENSGYQQWEHRNLLYTMEIIVQLQFIPKWPWSELWRLFVP